MHRFAINGDAFRPECNGVEGIVAAYKNSLNHIELGAPTNFAPVIDLVNQRAKALEVSPVNQQYNVLMIITDGDITDFNDTVD